MPGLKTTQKHFNKTRHFEKLARDIQNHPNMYISINILYTENKSKRTTTTLPSCQEHLLVRFERIYMKTHGKSLKNCHRDSPPQMGNLMTPSFLSIKRVVLCLIPPSIPSKPSNHEPLGKSFHHSITFFP